jgi:hypothetical protein
MNMNNSDHNLRGGGSSMDNIVKKKDPVQMPFMIQSNTLVPATDTMLSPNLNRDDKNTKSIITLENADL